MYIAVIFWAIQITLLYTGYSLVVNTSSQSKTVKRFVAKSIFTGLADRLSSIRTSKDTESFFAGIGFNVSPAVFSTIKNLVLILATVVSLFKTISTKQVVPVSIISILFLAYLLLHRKKLFGIRTPLSYLVQILRNLEQQKVDKELSKLLTILKNLAIASEQKPLSAETVISILVKFSSRTRNLFVEYQALYRLNRLDEAYELFKKYTNSRLGETFVSIISKLDFINPSELVNQIAAAQEAARESIVTKRISSDKAISDLAFIPILLQIVAILLNFAAIVMVIDTINQFNEIFYM